MEDDIKRWTAKRKAVLVMEIIQGKTTVAEASRSFDLPPSEIEEWVDEAKERCWSYAPEKSWPPCWATRTRNDLGPSAGIESRRY
jgi:transposase-like protein